MKNIQNQLFGFTILFFLMTFIHIAFALLGIACFILPFIQYKLYKDKVWCKYYCPRAGFFNKIVKPINMGLKTPQWLMNNRFKKGVVSYFTINILFATMSTIMVTLGRIDPIDQIRFLIVFGLPIELPQLIELALHPSLLHVSYRIYSMMFTSVIIGSLMGILFKPRTWCAICPIQTLTTKNKL